MDEHHRGAYSGSADENEQAVQVYRHVRHHGKERRRPSHCDVVLLGQHNRWELHCEMGKQDHVLHSLSLWSGHLVYKPAALLRQQY